MNQTNCLKQQFGCGQNGCGQNGSLCHTCGESFIDSTQTACPDGNPRCSREVPCDLCQSIAQSIVKTPSKAFGEGKALDVKPLQGFANEDQCANCGKTIGSNPGICGICASILESPLNPAQPLIGYNPKFGPEKGSFGPCTAETTRNTLVTFRRSFEASKIHGLPFTEINNFKMSASHLKLLILQMTVLGIEGFNNSCFYVVVFWMLSQGNMHERINTNCISGYILYKILWDLRFKLFIGRDIVEAFRLSLKEYPLIQRRQTEFELGMNDPIDLLMLFEDDEIGILRKGPIFSATGCSFHICETIGELRCSSIQDALYESVSSHSLVPEDCSIISFQFSQQKTAEFTVQTLGTDFEFPHNGVFLAGKLLRPRMFIIFKSQHYSVVLCVGESFFLANSISASQCGHFLPETSKILEVEAMGLFKTQAHTIVFECVGDVPPPPPP